MRKIYYLKTCSTCQKILKQIPNIETFELQDIKTNPISAEELEKLYLLSDSYEALFSKRATLYKEQDLKNKQLKEEDYKNLILEHYTFLSRPVIVVQNHIFIGNSPKNITAFLIFLENE